MMLSLGFCAILHVGKQVIFIHLSPVSLSTFAFLVTLENTDEEPKVCLKQIRSTKNEDMTMCLKAPWPAIPSFDPKCVFSVRLSEVQTCWIEKTQHCRNSFSCVTMRSMLSSVKLYYSTNYDQALKHRSFGADSTSNVATPKDFLPPNCSLRCPPPASQEDRILHGSTLGAPNHQPEYMILWRFLKMNYLG